VHVKGAAPRMHEWRPFTARMLGHILCPGSGTFGSGFDMRSPNADLGYPEPTKRDTPKGKAEEVFIHTKQRYFLEATGICYFGISESRKGQHQDMVDALAAITGWKDLTLDEVLTVGERILQHERVFNVRHGLTPEDDYQNVGQRFIDPVPDGPYKGWTIAPYLKGLVFDFYRIAGWDERTGVPYKDTLRRLGIDSGYRPAI